MSDPCGGRSGTIYQIYPRSFQDSDGDGIGDLRGIESRLDYLVALGVDAIWISPIYPSPMADFGYDVADYCGIDPLFGTLADFDRCSRRRMLAGSRCCSISCPTTAPSEHPWFVESRASRDNPKRDWYIWRDPAPGGGPPNNWISDFGGSAWEWDEATGQYYYHAFLKEQPDLNWRNPEVRAAMLDVLRFWFDRGVDGFRIDVLWHMIKHAGVPRQSGQSGIRARDGRDAPACSSSTRPTSPRCTASPPRCARSRTLSRARADRRDLPAGRSADALLRHGGEPGVHLPFNFQLIEAPWEARGHRPADRRLRGRAARGRLAELGARQP